MNADNQKFLKWCLRHPLISVGVVLLVLALVCFLLIDRPLLQFMDGHSTDFHTKPTINAFRQFGKAWVPLWLLLMWACLTPWRKAVTASLLAMVIVMPLLLPLKYTFNRLRPEKQLIKLHNPEATEAINAGSPSFPSGDTATVFAIAAALGAFCPLTVSIPAYLIAAAIGVLRVVSLDHFPSDVCVGAAIGLFAGYWAARIIDQSPHVRINPPEQFKWKAVVLALVIGMPLWISIFETSNPLIVFLKSFWPHVLLFFLTVVTLGRQIPTGVEESKPEEHTENNQ